MPAAPAAARLSAAPAVRAEDHLRLIGFVIRQFLPDLPPGDRPDLEGELAVELVRCAAAFDPARGRTFSTYAAVCLRKRACRYFRTMHRQRAVGATYRRGGGTKIVYIGSANEDVGVRTVSGDLTGDYTELAAAAAPDHAPRVERAEELRAVFDAWLAGLRPRDRRCVRLAFDLKTGERRRTTEEVAAHLGRSRERTRQRLDRAQAALWRLLPRADRDPRRAGSVTDAPPATAAGRGKLFDGRLGRYRFVHKHSASRWAAKIRLPGTRACRGKLVHVGTAPTPEQAADLAAAWLDERYPDGWPEFARKDPRREAGRAMATAAG